MGFTKTIKNIWSVEDLRKRIGITLLLVILANKIILSLTGLANLAALPLTGALALIGISMALTLIAGLIPARIAARKDPVVALRSE